MKLLKNIALAGILTLGLTSCEDWLDVNVNPDSPSNESVILANRLPWMQKFYMYFEGPTNMRTSCMAGVYYSTGAAGQFATTWNCQSGQCTTSYQIWFVGVGANYQDTYNRAKNEGAYHYMAAANVIYAMGFMNLLDEYGEMPMSDALGASVSPKYDDGKTMYYAVLDKIDEAIELFGKEQEPGATALAVGDLWNNGSIDKWVKMCYGLKARYLMRITKKAEWDGQAVLDALAKAPQSNADNSYSVCFNDAADRTDWLWGDPIMTNGNYDYVSYGTAQRYTKYFKDKLVNMRGSGVEDPRMSKIIPAAMSNVVLGSDGRVQSNDWVRSEGVDCTGDAARLVSMGWSTIQLVSFAANDAKVKYGFKDIKGYTKEEFVNDYKAIGYTEVAKDPKARQLAVDGDSVEVVYPKGSLYVNSKNPLYAGDTVYVNLKCGALRVNNYGQSAIDCNFYTNQAAYNAGVVTGSGSFQTRPISDQDFVTYHEMCFLKAECLLRLGRTAEAYQAYRDGIKAHMDRMQTKLEEWKGLGTTNPDMMPMDPAAIEAYMNSAAVCQNAGSLTMSDIMLQKYVAMGSSIENWVDMRRFNYSAGNVGNFGVVYPGYDRSPVFAGQQCFKGNTPQDVNYWIRRMSVPTSLELGYNEANALAMNKHAEELWVWCIPVWWDCATDQEYFAGIQ